MSASAKKNKNVEQIVGIASLLLGALVTLAPLLLLKTVPGGVVYNPVCTSGQTSFCLTSTDLVWSGLGLATIGVFFLFAASGWRRRRGAADPRLIAAIALFGLALFALFFKPIPDCATGVNLLFISWCSSPTHSILGMDPNVFLALAFAVLATVVLIFGSAKFGKASIVAR